MLPDEPALPERTRLGPPGVDVHIPSGRATIRRRDLERAGGEARGRAPRRPGAARPARPQALRALDPARDRIVSYVGKLIVSKGVDLLLAAWPLVVAKVPDARLVVVGFGTYREAVEPLRRGARHARTSTPLREIAARGRELEGGPPGELRYLSAFLDSRWHAEWLRRGARRGASGSTSPGGSSTRTCPTCSRPARPR